MADSKPSDSPATPGSATPPAGERSTAEETVESMAEQALESADAAAEALKAEVGGAGMRAPDLPDFDGGDGAGDPGGLDLLRDVDLKVKIELGRTRMYVEDVLRLDGNAVVELDKAAGDPVDIYVNDRPVARGEVLVVDDQFCVRISEILESSEGESGT